MKNLIRIALFLLAACAAHAQQAVGNINFFASGTTPATPASGVTIFSNSSAQPAYIAAGGGSATLTPTGTDPFIAQVNAMGAGIIAESVGLSPLLISVSINLGNQSGTLVAIYLPVPATITGVMWYQMTRGSYTPNNFNGVALYSVTGGTLTQVAISANNGTIWSASASSTYGTQAFTSTYAAAAGIYFVGFLYNESAQVTAPGLGAAAQRVALGVNTLLSNNLKFVGTIAGLASLPSPTQAASGMTSSNIAPWLALY